MIPTEQIQTELGFSDVYLVEGRSIGGLSGSPVFVRRTETIKVRMEDGRITTLNSPGPFKLLGLMQGHWDIKESDMNKARGKHGDRNCHSRYQNPRDINPTRYGENTRAV